MRWRRKKPHVHRPVVGTEKIYTFVEVEATGTCDCGAKLKAAWGPDEIVFKEVPK